MAPSNPYLEDKDVQQRLAAHNNRLIKRTSIEFLGEEPEVHWDFNRAVEFALLNAFLDQFAEPDFRDGKVTVKAAAGAVYGSDVDDYLQNRAIGLLRPASGFNKEYSLNGLLFVALANGSIARANRGELADSELITRTDMARERLEKTALVQFRGINAAYKRAVRIDPENKARLEARRGELESVIGRSTMAILGAGPSAGDAEGNSDGTNGQE
jgi:hypothetical protein